MAGEYVSRNQLLDESAEVYAERNSDRTDILHEYFVPTAQFTAFLDRARVIIPQSHCDLLNVTVRNVLEDKYTRLRYADQDMFAFVMLFNQGRSSSDDLEMQQMTRQLIDAALGCGGRYYLPYRLHATEEQFEHAYPQAKEFFASKHKYDPDDVFQNELFTKYGRQQ